LTIASDSRHNKTGAPAERPQTLAHSFFSHPPLCRNEMSTRARWPASRRSGVARKPAHRRARPRVSVPPSSGFAMVPLVVALAHNPRVVTGDRLCGGVTFPDSNGVSSGERRAQGESQGHRSLARVSFLTCPFNSFLRFGSFLV
jgi:hypothetical protein